MDGYNCSPYKFKNVSFFTLCFRFSNINHSLFLFSVYIMQSYLLLISISYQQPGATLKHIGNNETNIIDMFFKVHKPEWNVLNL